MFLNYLIYYFLNWSIVNLPCCVNLCCTAEWLSYTHIYILFYILYHYGLSWDIEYNSLCYTIGPCLSILYIIIVCFCWSQTPSLFLSHPPFPLATTSLFSMSVSRFPFHRYVHLCHILDSMYKWYHMVFVFLCLTYFI